MDRLSNLTKERNVMRQAKIYIGSQAPNFNCKSPHFSHILDFSMWLSAVCLGAYCSMRGFFVILTVFS